MIYNIRDSAVLADLVLLLQHVLPDQGLRGGGGGVEVAVGGPGRDLAPLLRHRHRLEAAARRRHGRHQDDGGEQARHLFEGLKPS